MKYHSTRGGHKGMTFEEAVFSGFLSDGGILLPEDIPKVTQEQMTSWAKMSYLEILRNIITLFVDESEMSRHDVNFKLARAFKRFTGPPDIVELKRLSNDLNVLELFHGPTLAFKDLALSCLGQFMELFLRRKKKHITVVVGTSGDTGSAALESVRGLNCVDMIVMLPRGRCTRVQELQMTTVVADNVHIYRVEGTSDDLDVPIKACFTDVEFAEKHHLSSMNSINWGRILVQIAHYFYACLKMCPTAHQEVEIVVPTGACGNVTAGCLARAMGLPIRMVCAVNTNDIVARTLQNGDFSISGPVTKTWASAMDIQMPYNMERLLYIFSDGNVELVRTLIEEAESTGKVTIPEDLLTKMRSALSSHVATDADIQETMRRCWEENQYLLCPHTAVAAHYHYNTPRVDPNCPRVILATASPAKFEEAVQSAGLTPQPTKEVTNLANKPVKYEEMLKGQDWEAMLRAKIDEITAKHSS